MTDPTAGAKARAVLAKNRADALKIQSEKGLAATRAMLESAKTDLEARLAKMPPSADTFSAIQMRATLEQVKQVIADLNRKITKQLVEHGKVAAQTAAEHTADYLKAADDAYRGVGVQPLALNEARMVDSAIQGTQASLLRRLASSGEPESRVGRLGEVVEEHPAKLGILQRYGMRSIGEFESILQRGMVARKSFDDMREEITAQSPFLQGQPRFWAERIVRTELMGAYNRGAFEATREADEDLGDVVKILSATFDERTAADSYAVHGQIRRPTEAFETWTGMHQHPPARPNDREVVVTHRIAWKIPDELKWKSEGEIAARWAAEHPPPKRKGTKPRAMPAIPLRTTVPIEDFGKPPKAKESEKQPDEKKTPEDARAGGEEQQPEQQVVQVAPLAAWAKRRGR